MLFKKQSGLDYTISPDMLTTNKLTTKNIRTDVCWTATLVFQQVIITDQVFAKTEVGDGDSSTPLVENHVAQLEVTMNYVFLSKRKTRN